MNERLPDFGDLIRAFAVLRPRDEEARRELASLLGFDYARPRPEVAPAPAPLPLPPPPPPPETPNPQSSILHPQSATPPPQHNPFNTDLRPSVLRPLAPKPEPVPEWGTAAPLAPPPATRAEPPATEPLLVPRWTRGILSAALSGRSAEGEIDIEAVVRTIGNARPFRSVPRRFVPRFGRGVQVLVDASESMAPFAGDQEWLTERIRVVAGRDRTRVLGIDGSETFIAGEGSRFEWTDYFERFVPLPGVVAILLTDLGIGRMPLAPWTTPGQWLSFAAALRKRGVPLVAVVPYGRERWPAALRRVIPIVQWDAGTTARSARRALETRLRQYGRSGP
ncbi:MAG TPA: hypothetical protein VEO54_05715 [Thermoanaerobaculia bacterium]|nr:hypothetical protein [Thermoanaerobaculia bacterium]